MCALIKNFKIQDSPNPVLYIKGQFNNYYENTIKTFMGRDAINILLYNIRKKSVLLPAYVCKEVVSEFQKYNYKIYFYDIKKDFTIDLDNVKSLIGKERIDVFYFIVYFGFKSLYSHIPKELKKLYPYLYIIEDRAHYISNSHKFQECDAYIYSFRKLLPVTVGGGLATKENVKFKYNDKLLANVLPPLIFFRKIFLKHIESLSSSNIMKTNSPGFIKPNSFLSNNVIRKNDYQEDIQLRRNQFNQWINKLALTDLKPVLTQLRDEDIPLGCPIWVDDAAVVQKSMESWGYYLKRHWPLSEEYESIAPSSYAISKQIITLPIYKAIKESDQDKMLRLLLKSINRNV